MVWWGAASLKFPFRCAGFRVRGHSLDTKTDLQEPGLSVQGFTFACSLVSTSSSFAKA